MSRKWTIEEDTVFLNLLRSHDLEHISGQLARPIKALEARMEYLKDKRIVSGVDGKTVLQGSAAKAGGLGDPEHSRSGLAQKIMEQVTFVPRV